MSFFGCFVGNFEKSSLIDRLQHYFVIQRIHIEMTQSNKFYCSLMGYDFFIYRFWKFQTLSAFSNQM